MSGKAKRRLEKERERLARQRQGEGQPLFREVPGVPDTYELTVSTLQLPAPERTFYGNVIRITVHEGSATFAFGQLIPGENVIFTTLGIDMPNRSIVATVSSFDPAFRSIVASRKGSLPEYPAQPRPLNSLTYPAHVAKVIVNEMLGVIDFYEITPTIGSSPMVDRKSVVKRK